MPFEYKLAVLFICVGLSNILLRNNRNWIFGYRSERALKSHLRFAYANLIYGAGLVLVGVSYGCWLYFFEGLEENYAIWKQLVCLAAYFVVLFALIELKLQHHFKDG